MNLTASELRFEEYCRTRDYRFARIELPQNTRGRRPDYRLYLPGGEVIAEVKQIEPGPWEEEVDRRMKEHGRADLSRAIGVRARSMIRNAAPQLKRYADEQIPCVLFAYDLTWHTYLSDVDIDAAMFGQPIVRFFSAEQRADNEQSAFGHSGKRQMTQDSRRYISAVAVMERRALVVHVYHNPFAKVPLFPRYLPHLQDRHFIKGDHPERSGHLWLEYVGPRE